MTCRELDDCEEMDGWMDATHDRTDEGGGDGRSDASAARGPQLAAGGIKVEGKLLVRELGVEHERDEAEREHRRRHDEHEEAWSGAR